MITRAYFIGAYAASWLLFGAVGLIFNAGCALLLLLPGRARRQAASREAIRHLFAIWVGWLRLTGLVAITWEGAGAARLPRGTVYVANHPGLLDATFLLTRLPDAVCIFKPGLRHSPFLAPAALAAGYLPGDTGVDLVREIAQKVAEGCTVLIFPEGTRTNAGTVLNPCKPRVRADRPAGGSARAAAGHRGRSRAAPAPRPLVVGAAFSGQSRHPRRPAHRPRSGSPDRRLGRRSGAPAARAPHPRGMIPSATHLVLVPSYDTGARRLLATVTEALRWWQPVWVVIDGSTDASGAAITALAATEPGLRVIVRPRNGGKGAAIATGTAAALAAGFTHVLTMDADGQHPADLIPAFMAASARQPAALVLGKPIFGPDAPLARLYGRKLSAAMTWLQIFGPGIDDPLFGFRVYPAAPLQRVLSATRFARGFDFDHEAAVRLFWDGTPTLNLPAPCRYLAKAEGGVSHFHYLRDNALLIWLQLRLFAQLAAGRWAAVIRIRSGRDGPAAAAD